LTYNDLLGEVGLFLGWGRGSASGEQAWSSLQQAAVESCVKSGLRNFYYPPPTAGTDSPYDWSFLKPVATLTLPVGVTRLNLPDDFGGCEGRVTVSVPGGGRASWWGLDTVGIGTVVARLASMPDTTGRPEVCAVEPIKGTTASAGQRFALRV